MITYIYWIIVILVALNVLVLMAKGGNWKAGLGVSATILIVATLAYFFQFQQWFVKNYGGVMSLKVPEGQYHIAATWKDDNLWTENYDPEKNICIFQEYSKGNVLEGKVIIKNCNPLLPSSRFITNNQQAPGN